MGTWPRLTADQLDLNIDSFDFEQSLSDTLGDFGTSRDGFDAYVNETGILLAGVGNPGDSLVDDLSLAASVGGSIDANSLLADAQSLPASLAAGDAILADASSLAGGTQVPGPPTGGGGAPAPAPAPAPSPCVNATFGEVQAYGQLLQRTVQITNTSKVVMVIQSVTGPGAAYVNVVKVTPDLTRRILAPGVSVAVTISVLAVPGNYSGKITYNTNAPDPQPCILWGFTGIDPSSRGGAGPPTGILKLTGGGQPPGFGRNG